MNRVLAFVLLTFSAIALAQAPQLKKWSAVYIEPMGGYETYLAAALAKKQAPLILVTDKVKADYIITINQQVPAQPFAVLNQNPWAVATSMSISVIDVRSSQIVFAYAVSRHGNDRIQSAAESCAKHLKEFIENPGK